MNFRGALDTNQVIARTFRGFQFLGDTGLLYCSKLYMPPLGDQHDLLEGVYTDAIRTKWKDNEASLSYVMRSSDEDLYLLTLKTFAISQRHPPIQQLLEIATPKMRALTRKAWQSCNMGMESNGDIVVVASIESPGN